MAKVINFNADDCSYLYALDSSVFTSEKAAEDLAAMDWSLEDGVLKFTIPTNLSYGMVSTVNGAAGDTEASGYGIAYFYTNSYTPDETTISAMVAAGYDVQKIESGGIEYSKSLTDEQQVNLLGFQIQFLLSDADNGNGGILMLDGTGLVEDVADEGDDTEEDTDTDAKEPQYIYPTGTISIKDLAAVNIGFKNHQDANTYTHIRWFVSEIHDDTVGGAGHVWMSEFYEKDYDYLTVLEVIRSMCEGKEITHFNVLYYLLSYDGDANSYSVVDSYIVGGATDAVTFSVVDEAVKSPINLEDTAYCLDPVILTINRHEMTGIQKVTVEIGSYKSDYEFYEDRNILEIDISEYLQTLFSNVDLFEHQKLTSTIFVKLLDESGEILEKQGITITAIYGKNPDPEIGDEVRVQWLDKYGFVHDEYFVVAENLTEGESEQKYVVNREEREDKTGTKSITLAYVLANASQREILKTIVFSDHIRAFIGNDWKRVKVANTYKNGIGREKQNFEFTIKYSL